MSTNTDRGLAALRRFAQAAPAPARCELCATPLAERHAHLFEPEPRRLLCACIACGLLFPAGERSQRVRVETHVLPLRDLQLSDLDWAALDVPVRLVFLCPSTRHQQLFATYPSPQGAVEARLPLAAWHALLRNHPQLNEMPPEHDALVIDGRSEPGSCARVSIDVCHALIGHVRAHRRSVAAWQALEQALLRLQRGEPCLS